ncbi:MAG: hypothetical protein MUF22_03715 [Chitinispirillaceae bacterium]|jgi:predicted Fe-Mo cluster-binding NifX family protein|nr:hypothetical protein [Chitinispirillaceae bacterium]
METIAITFWDGLVSPLFDAAAAVLIVGPEREGRLIRLGDGSIRDKAAILAKHETATLICGAISADAAAVLSELGIKVVSWVRGPVDKVLEAYKNGSLVSEAFLMPGCHNRCRGRGRGQQCRKSA